MRDFLERKTPDKNPYDYFTMDEAKNNIGKLFSSDNDSSTAVLNTERPNIVFIQLESFTADIIEPLGGIKDVTPFLTSLIDSSLLFTNIYSSGFRTHHSY